MDHRRIESGLARFTLGFVAVYLPVETYASWRYGLLNPFYIVDAHRDGATRLGRASLAAWGAAKPSGYSLRGLWLDCSERMAFRSTCASTKFAAARDSITAMPNTGSSSASRPWSSRASRCRSGSFVQAKAGSAQ
jgi:hypothetical protein